MAYSSAHPGCALACVARCPVCYQPVPGMPARCYGDKMIRLDMHLNPVHLRHLGWCIGSRSYMKPNWELR
jgi:hypothetical protein